MACTLAGWLEAISKHQHGEFDREFLERVAGWLDAQVKSKGTERR
jgi:hypothetical protein